jgi:hypothetical protein
MSFSWPTDKTGVVNNALSSTGDNTISVADDGSDEWNVCSPAYESGLSYAMESHSWGFATVLVTLQPSPTAPQDTTWDTAYPIPQDCVHVVWVKINQDTSDPVSQTQSQLTLYDIMGTPNGPVIVVNAMGGPPPPPPGTVTPATITMKYLSNAGALCDSTNGTPTLILALQAFVMSGIYRGLHEDPAEGDKMWAAGEMMLQKARTRYDQQKPKRQFFNSRMEASRRVRRPWPQIGNNNWGGSGTPGIILLCFALQQLFFNGWLV